MLPGIRLAELALELLLEIWKAMTPEQKQEVIQRWLNDTGAFRKDVGTVFTWVRTQFEALTRDHG